MERSDNNPPRLGVVPKNGLDASTISKLDLLSKVDASNHVRNCIRGKAEGRQQRFSASAASFHDHVATTVSQFRKSEMNLLLPVDEEASMAFVFFPLLRQRTGKRFLFVRVKARAEQVL